MEGAERTTGPRPKGVVEGVSLHPQPGCADTPSANRSAEGVGDRPTTTRAEDTAAMAQVYDDPTRDSLLVPRA